VFLLLFLHGELVDDWCGGVMLRLAHRLDGMLLLSFADSEIVHSAGALTL
jgi:hypothetical protein